MFDRDLLQDQQYAHPGPDAQDFAGETIPIPEAAIGDTEADGYDGFVRTETIKDRYVNDDGTDAAITAPEDHLGETEARPGYPAQEAGHIALLTQEDDGQAAEEQVGDDEAGETQPAAAAADPQVFELNREEAAGGSEDATAEAADPADEQVDQPAEPSAAEQSADLAATAQAEAEPAAEEEPQAEEPEPAPAAADQVPEATEPTIEDEPAAAAADDSEEDSQNAASGGDSAAEEGTEDEPVIPAQRGGGGGGDKPPEDPGTGGEGTGDDDEGEDGNEGHEGVPHLPQPPLVEGEIRKFEFDDPEWKTREVSQTTGEHSWVPTPPVQPAAETEVPAPDTSEPDDAAEFVPRYGGHAVDSTLDSVVVGRGATDGMTVDIVAMSEGDITSEIAAGGPTSDSSVVVTLYQPETQEGAIVNISSMDVSPNVGFDLIERAFDAAPSLDEPGTEIKVFGGNEQITTEQGGFQSHNDAVANYLGTHKRPDDVELVRGLPGGLDVMIGLSGGVVEAYDEFGNAVDTNGGGTEGGEAGGGNTGGGE